MKCRLIAAAVLVGLLSTSLHAQRPSQPTVATRSPQRGNERFELFPTKNVWVFLLLDSSNGRVWQLHYSLADTSFAGRLPLNENELAPSASAHVGRFTLQETQNIFTFLLLDQDDGRVWQLQWSNDDEKRGIVRVLGTALP